MNLLNIISIFIIFSFFITSFLFIKDFTRVILTMEKLFISFLNIEKSSLDFSNSYFNFFANSLRKSFHAEHCLLFFCNNNNIKISVKSSEELKSQEINENINMDEIVLSEIEVSDIKKKRLNKKTINKIFQKNVKYKAIYNQYIVFPIIQNKKISSFFIFFYKSYIQYIRALKLIFFNQKKLSDIILDIITVVRSREQDIFSIMMEKIRDYAFITSDNSLNITTWNKGAEIMFGYETDEVLGKNLIEFIDIEYRQEFQRAVIISGKKEETKIKIKMVDFNDTLIVSEILLKRINVNNDFMGYYILIKDVSKDEVIRENMKTKSMINRNIVENARDGIILLNEEDKIIFYNEKIKNIVENKVSFLGMDLANVFPINLGEKVNKNIMELKKTNIELNFLDICIGDLWYNIRFFPIKTNISEYRGVIIFFIDNTLRMKNRMELEEKTRQIEVVNKNLLDDLIAARALQIGLTPKKLPVSRNFKFEKLYYLSEQIGGDFYYVEELKIKRRKFFIIMLTDVSGHGVVASMLSVFVKEIYNEFKDSLEELDDIKPSVFLKMLNRKIFELNVENNNYITAYFSIVDVSKKSVKYSSAGSPFMVLIKSNGLINFYGIKKSPPVGIVEDFNYQEGSFDIKSGDKIILYTDGLLDIFSSNDSYYGYFNDFLQSNKQKEIKEIKKLIENKLNDLINKKEIMDRDDVTAIFAKFQ